jgi:hypothetical protein
MNPALDMDISLGFNIMTYQFPHPYNTEIPAFQAGVIRSLQSERVTVVLQGLMRDDTGADDIDFRSSIHKGSQGVFPSIDNNR